MSVKRLPSGRYQPRFSRQVNGHQKEVAKNFPTKEEAERWEREQETKADLGECVEPSKQTLAAWFDEYLAGRVGIDGRTRADLEDVFRRYWRPTLGEIKLNRLTTEMIRRELRTLEVAEKSPRTIQQAHSILRQVLGGAVEAGRLGRNPAVASDMIPKQVKKPLAVLSAAEMRSFLDAGADDPLVAFWAIQLYAGLRPSETIALRWRDVDLSEPEPQVSVHRSFERARRGFAGDYKGTKTNQVRTVPLLRAPVRLLRARRAVASLVAGGRDITDDLIFTRANGRPLRGAKLSEKFQAALTAAGLRKLRLYDCRHSAATLWLEAGVEMAKVSKMLGHTSITMTVNTYGHIRPKALHQAAVRVAAFVDAEETEAA